MKVARAVKMHRQNMRLKTNLTMFSPQLRPDKKNWNLIRFSGPAEAYQQGRISEDDIGHVSSQQYNHGILDCPGLVRYQEMEAVLVSDQVTRDHSQLPGVGV